MNEEILKLRIEEFKRKILFIILELQYRIVLEREMNVKKAGFVLIGLLPFLGGYIINGIILNLCYYTVLPYTVIGMISLMIWGMFGALIKDKVIFREAIILVHIPALVVLSLNFVQLVILGRYFASSTGIATQLFFLPFIRIAAIINPIKGSVFSIYLISFSLMIMCFYIGYTWRNRYTKESSSADV